jgi:hypothetical protein
MGAHLRRSRQLVSRHAFFAHGRLPEAIAQYQVAVQFLPDSAILHHNLASALAKFPERLPEAIVDLLATRSSLSAEHSRLFAS